MCGFHAQIGCKLSKSLFEQFLDVQNKWLYDYYKSKGIYDERENDRNSLQRKSRETTKIEADL